MSEPTLGSGTQVPREIGLSLSGGGFRAATFHLGALSYLHHVDLLDRVRVLSTVSGGTFTGAKYVLALVDAKRANEEFEFVSFMRGWYDDLAGSKLVESWLDKLGGDAPNTPDRRDHLIVAAAETYADTFFRDSSGDARLFSDILTTDIHVKEVVFNATDFRHGFAFRFQKTASGVIGNNAVRIPADAAGSIRVADIVAASSCFPGGFEPIAFPGDFHWPAGGVPAGIRKTVRSTGPIALMDGGVYDNQGLESLFYADERRTKARAEDALDLVIVSDTDPRQEVLYERPEHAQRGRLTVGVVSVGSWLLVVVCALVLLASIARGVTGGSSIGGLEAITLLASAALAAGIAALVVFGRWKIARVLDEIPNARIAAWTDVRRMRVSTVENFIRLRVASLFSMGSSVFMKRVRGLGYSVFHLTKRYEGKRVSNLIYHLTPGSPFAFTDREGIDPPSAALEAVARTAREMPTTLWWNDGEQQPALVATGQATLCYNLMKWIDRRPDADDLPADVEALRRRLVADWNEFVRQPHWLAEEQLESLD